MERGHTHMLVYPSDQEDFLIRERTANGDSTGKYYLCHADAFPRASALSGRPAIVGKTFGWLKEGMRDAAGKPTKEAPPHAGKVIRISHDEMVELHPHGRSLLDQYDNVFHMASENAGLEPFYVEQLRGAQVGWLPHGDTRTREDLELTTRAIEAGK